jgi:hypothetical protein
MVNTAFQAGFLFLLQKQFLAGPTLGSTTG